MKMVRLDRTLRLLAKLRIERYIFHSVPNAPLSMQCLADNCFLTYILSSAIYFPLREVISQALARGLQVFSDTLRLVVEKSDRNPRLSWK